jgi:acetylornithine aminotransferase
MVGVGLSRDIAPAVAAAALDAGLIVNAIGPRTLRLVPPLIITREEVDEAMSRLGRAFASVEAGA